MCQHHYECVLVCLDCAEQKMCCVSEQIRPAQSNEFNSAAIAAADRQWFILLFFANDDCYYYSPSHNSNALVVQWVLQMEGTAATSVYVYPYV